MTDNVDTALLNNSPKSTTGAPATSISTSGSVVAWLRAIFEAVSVPALPANATSERLVTTLIDNRIATGPGSGPAQ